MNLPIFDLRLLIFDLRRYGSSADCADFAEVRIRELLHCVIFLGLILLRALTGVSVLGCRRDWLVRVVFILGRRDCWINVRRPGRPPGENRMHSSKRDRLSASAGRHQGLHR